MFPLLLANYFELGLALSVLCSSGFTDLWRIMMSFAASSAVKSGPSRSRALRFKLKPTPTLQKLWSFTMRLCFSHDSTIWRLNPAVHWEYIYCTNNTLSSIPAGSEHWAVEWWWAHWRWEGLLGNSCYGGLQSSDRVEVPSVLRHCEHRWELPSKPGEDVVRSALPGNRSDLAKGPNIPGKSVRKNDRNFCTTSIYKLYLFNLKL